MGKKLHLPVGSKRLRKSKSFFVIRAIVEQLQRELEEARARLELIRAIEEQLQRELDDARAR